MNRGDVLVAYDSELRKKLSSKRKLEEIWQAAIRGEEFHYVYVLKPPVELAKSAGKISAVNEWSLFWKQTGAYWHLHTANKKAGIMGMQHDFPDKVEFVDTESVLRYLGEWARFKRLCEKCQKIMADFPQLSKICVTNREEILTISGMSESILELARYFSGNYRTNCYLRELDIPYVHTKFIESRKKLTADIFFSLHTERDGRSFGDLCEQLRWTVQAPTPNIYVRSLDRRKSIGGLQTLMVTAEQLAHLQVSFSKVFFTENKLNGYVFPEVNDGLMIFGAGNGVIADELTIPWLTKQEELWYWGDMDFDGLRILSRVREKYPQVRSFLMNRDLAEKYRHFMTADTGSKLDMPDNLTLTEKDCWAYLTSRPEHANRLEQEKIPLAEVKAFLQTRGAYGSINIV